MKIVSMILFALVLVWPQIGSSSEQEKARYPFKIATYNIRNFAALDQEPSEFRALDGATDSKVFAQTMQELNSQVIAFQEIINGPLFERLMKDSLPKHRLVMTECGGTADQKLALAYDQRVFELERFEEDWRVALSNRCHHGLRPALVAWLRHRASNKKIAFVVVHLKAGPGDRNRATRREQHQVLSSILKDLKQQQIDDIIFLGDFNTTSFFEQTPGAAQFAAFLSENELSNTGKDIGCSSYWEGDRGDGKMWPSHLDHILHQGSASVTKPQALTHCARARCRPVERMLLGTSFESVSDHCPVRVQVKLAR